ncbi:MAG TPA: response regulator [bacterium]|nr:response regulator [bacterium]
MKGQVMAAKNRLVIVEDEIIVAEDLAGTLTRQGYEIIGHASTGPEALRYCQVLHPDLVLMDIVLKGMMTGIDTAQRIKEEFDIPVIYVTAYADEKTLEQAKTTGPFGYILKPFTERELKSTIEMALYKHAMDRKVREKEAWLSTILKSIGDGVVVVDIHGKIDFMNSVAEMLTGCKLEQARSRSLPELIVLESKGIRIDLNRLIRDVIQWKKVLHLPDIIIKPREQTKEIPIDDCIAPLIGSDGKVMGVVLVFKDITERRLVEDEKEKIHAQLLHAQKMEAIGLLAGGIAHDFNNLLTVIEGNTNLAMMKIDDSNELFQGLVEIESAAERAADLTNQLLLFSRKQPMNFGAVPLNDVIRRMTKMLKLLIGEDVRLVTHLDANLDPIYGDRGTIEQIIMNLAVNARDAMPEGGSLTIGTRQIQIQADDVESMPEARSGTFVCMTVGDTGEGMSEEVIPHIFEPFFSTKTPGKGTGLGLSVVYGIVKQHDGWIRVSSKPGKGTTFYMYLPLVYEDILTRSDSEPKVRRLDGGGRKVLVVEDEQGVRIFLDAALKGSGFEVSMAANIKEAREMINRGMAFDLIFCDVVLPDGNGFEFVESVHKQNPNLPSILSSGYTGPKSMWDEIRKKGYRFLKKPFNLDELIVSIQEVLGR